MKTFIYQDSLPQPLASQLMDYLKTYDALKSVYKDDDRIYSNGYSLNLYYKLEFRFDDDMCGDFCMPGFKLTAFFNDDITKESIKHIGDRVSNMVKLYIQTMTVLIHEFENGKIQTQLSCK